MRLCWKSRPSPSPCGDRALVRSTLTGLLAVGLLLSPAALAGAACRIEAVPAATLLLPYFEVDLAAPDGITTLLSINNATAHDVIANVVFWTDMGVPLEPVFLLVHLSGFAVQSINLRDVLVNGLLPRSTPAPGFPGCAGVFPQAPLTPATVATLQAALTGRPSGLCGGCCGRPSGTIARGYLTVDVLNACSTSGPQSLGYFAHGTGLASNRNVLWGDVFYVHPAENFAQGNTLVHIEADAADPATSVPGVYTFYGRLINWTAADNREPLGTNFATRFLNGGGFTGGTDLLVWRDPKVNQGAFACPPSPLPAWFPLDQEAIVIYGEPGNFHLPPPGLRPFPAATQRIAVDGPDLPVPFNFGWLALNLNTTVPAAGPSPPQNPAAAQAWVSTLMDANGRYSVGFDALQFDSACDARHCLLPPCP